MSGIAYTLLVPLISAISLFHGITPGNPATYHVGYSGTMAPDKIIQDQGWLEAESITAFGQPWEKDSGQKTCVKALHNGHELFFLWHARDTTLTVNPGATEESALEKEDRVEIYFSANLALDDYYCLEIDPLGRVLDYQAKFYRKFDNSWKLEGLRVESQVGSAGYLIGLAIPLDTLSALMETDLNKPFYVGLYRADLNMESGVIHEKWISWIDPHSSSPDFHVPETFGTFQLKMNSF
jgi:hypothetical protein